MGESTGPANRPLVAIAGDVTVDWLFQRLGGERESLDFAWAWGEGLACRQCAQPGGAAFTSSLVQQSVTADPALRDTFTIVGPRMPARAVAAPGNRSLTKTFSILSLLPKQVGSRELVWRMTSYLGEDRADTPQPELLPELSGPPDYLLLHDTNSGFREQPERWKRLLTASATRAPAAQPEASRLATTSSRSRWWKCHWMSGFSVKKLSMGRSGYSFPLSALMSLGITSRTSPTMP